jgi:hypothetical protein
MHTDETLIFLDAVTIKLGKQLRQFQKDTCIAFKTQELRREAEHRQRQQSRSHVGQAEATTSTHQTTRRPKTFNLQTYKLHALGDYSTSIRNFGTTDSYSTEPVGKHVLLVNHELDSLWIVGRAGAPHLKSKVSSNRPERICGTNNSH